MRITSIGHAIFAVTMIVLGAVGLLHPDFVPLWNPVPVNVPARVLLVYLSALISVASGIGLLVQRMAAIAARLLLTTLFLWLLLLRLPNFLLEPAFEACWSVFPLMIMLAAAWVLYVWFAADWDRKHLTFISSNNGLRIARVLYGLSLDLLRRGPFHRRKRHGLAHPPLAAEPPVLGVFHGLRLHRSGPRDSRWILCTASSHTLSLSNRIVPVPGVGTYCGDRL